MNRNVGMILSAFVGAAVLAFGVALPAPAFAAPTCSFSLVTDVLEVDAVGEAVTIRRVASGTGIEVLDSNLAVVPCPPNAPDVNNVQQVDVDDGAGGASVTISLENGTFTPGVPAEATGVSEIEFLVDLGGGTDSLRIFGSGGADHIRSGAIPPHSGINLNQGAEAANPDGDDVLLLNGGGVETVVVQGDLGAPGAADTIEVNGGAPYTDPLPLFSQLLGEGGDDDLIAGTTRAFLFGGAGDDTLLGSTSGFSVGDTLAGGPGDDFMDGNLGNDSASYTQAAAGVRVDLANPAPQDTGGAGIDTIVGIENASGSGFNDVLLGTDGPNSLSGGFDFTSGLSGDDVLMGRGGDDVLDGFTGNDTASYEDGSTGPVSVDLQTVGAQDTGGAGVDTLPDSATVVDSDSESDIENLIGSPFGDTLTGNVLSNSITGLGGVDSINSLGAPDALFLRDGGPDVASCGDPTPGPPPDTAVADKQSVDSVNADCELIDFLPEDPPADEPPAGQPPADETPGGDTDPPETTIRRGPLRRTTDETPSFRFQSDEAGSTFECKHDKRPWRPCTSPKRLKRQPFGRHRFRVRATDPAGNVDPTPARRRYLIVE